MACQTLDRVVNTSVRVAGVAWWPFTHLSITFQKCSLGFKSGHLGGRFVTEKSDDCSSNEAVGNRNHREVQFSCSETPISFEWYHNGTEWRCLSRNSTYRSALKEAGTTTKDSNSIKIKHLSRCLRHHGFFSTLAWRILRAWSLIFSLPLALSNRNRNSAIYANCFQFFRVYFLCTFVQVSRVARWRALSNGILFDLRLVKPMLWNERSAVGLMIQLHKYSAR